MYGAGVTSSSLSGSRWGVWVVAGVVAGVEAVGGAGEVGDVGLLYLHVGEHV